MAVRVSKKGLQFTVLQWRKHLAQYPHRRWLNDGPDTIEELLERHVEKPQKRKEEDEGLARQRLTSTRREALALYREIFRATRFFVWPNEKGVLWRDILRANARQEFEDARYEKDPEIIARLLVGGRDAVHAAIDKAVEKYRGIVEKQKSGDNNRSVQFQKEREKVFSKYFYGCSGLYRQFIDFLKNKSSKSSIW